MRQSRWSIRLVLQNESLFCVPNAMDSLIRLHFWCIQNQVLGSGIYSPTLDGASQTIMLHLSRRTCFLSKSRVIPLPVYYMDICWWERKFWVNMMGKCSLTFFVIRESVEPKLYLLAPEQRPNCYSCNAGPLATNKTGTGTCVSARMIPR